MLIVGQYQQSLVKNSSSASNWLIAYFSTLFRLFPASQLNPLICAQLIIKVYCHHIQTVQVVVLINTKRHARKMSEF